MTVFRATTLYLRLARLVGVAICCPIALNAMSQELSVDSQLTPAAAVVPGGLAERVADPSQKSALPVAETVPVDIATLQDSINPLWLVPIESLSAIQDRPIFSPSRRRAADPSPSLVEHGPLPLIGQALRPALVLVGAVAGETDGIGIFLDEATKDIVRLDTEPREGTGGYLAKRR